MGYQASVESQSAELVDTLRRKASTAVPKRGANEHTDVTIIGAGPYGLSLAAHLDGLDQEFCIVGDPMKSWIQQMPKGMQLKSTGYASTLYDPGETFAIWQYCKEHNIPYEHVGLPVNLETFCDYGMRFQERFVPNVLRTDVTSVTRGDGGFDVKTADGRWIKSKRVVVGVGLDYFRHIPQELAGLPPELVSHSSAHSDLSAFRGLRVAVLGSGSSGIDLAILLHEAGAKVEVFGRNAKVGFAPYEPLRRPFWEEVLRPMSGIGAGWKNRICADFPGLFRYLPEGVRLRTVEEFLKPLGGWFMKSRWRDIPHRMAMTLKEAKPLGTAVQLRFLNSSGREEVFTVDRVVCATGFRTDVRKLSFLSRELVDGLTTLAGAPRLSPDFQSSVPGLYFIGPITAPDFGPVMRFAVGARYTAKRLSRHLAVVTAKARA